MKRLLVWSMVAFGGFGQTIQVHGHRGARAMRPENTLPAFEYAIAAGVDALELDMAVTRDNVIVVSHDPEMRAPICTGPRDHAVIRGLTLAEIRQWDCGAKQNPAFARQQPVPGTKMLTPEQVAAAHRAGIEVLPWTADTPADWERLVAARVDGIITDDPAALIAFLKQR